MTTFLPKYFTRKAIILYVLLLIICSGALVQNILPFRWVMFGIVEVFSFFYFSNLLTKRWGAFTPILFKRKLFRTALTIRMLYAVFIFVFYTITTGKPFEFGAADSVGYHEEAIWLIDLLQNNQLPIYLEYIKGNYSDLGYVVYLTAVYSLVGVNIFLVRLIKAVLGALTCVLVYKLCVRNFGENAGRIAGILALLSPNLIYYCGLHVKETEMVFLTVFFLERADLLIRQQKFNTIILTTTIILGLSLFFFRTVLGATAMTSLVIGFLLYSSQSVRITLPRKIAFGVIMIGIGLFLQGSRIEAEITRYWGDRDTNQRASMIARSESPIGNSLAKYGQTAIFAPLILIAPFPTLINIETQQNQMLLNGGYYTRNIYVFFLIIGLLTLWKRRQSRQHMLLLSFLFSYLTVLALSKFALAERFHMPILPVIIILAAFGVTQLDRKHIKFYQPYLALVALIILAWNIFKIAGRSGL
ncbi:glycosyltransferase family 39 protein [Spirosoma panaciterrae]|uniref:glycosyltransferase family 39 protein n=1 Tax=Spirosoma panaciterrae TaxID=496058 RepID=UPI00038254D5|nr:glycosyltransferase family 39 protein [Spirosoma panaciterrae]